MAQTKSTATSEHEMHSTAQQAAGSGTGHAKTKVEKAQNYLGLMSTTIGIVGAVGTAFVWLTTNLYVGNVELKTSRPLEAMQVKVVDGKGQQGTYFTNRIQLMPGKYHLQVGEPDKKPLKHLDISVQLWKDSVVSVDLPLAGAAADNNESAISDDAKGGKRHWWQFWRKADKSLK